MSSAHSENEGLWRVEARAVGVGAAAGLLGGLAMGIIFQFGTGLMSVFGAFAGNATLLRGWLVHLLISAFYGAVFAAVVGYPHVQSFMRSFDATEYVFAGVTYAVMVAAFSIALLPFAFDLPWVAASFDSTHPTVPGLVFDSIVSLVSFGIGHLVYGAILGFVYVRYGETPE